MNPSKLLNRVVLGCCALVTGGLGCLTWQATRVEYYQVEEHGVMATNVEKAMLVFGVLAVILFALSVQWLAERRWLRFALSFPAFPVWCVVMACAPTFVSTQAAILVRLAPLAGIDVFGP